MAEALAAWDPESGAHAMLLRLAMLVCEVSPQPQPGVENKWVNKVVLPVRTVLQDYVIPEDKVPAKVCLLLDRVSEGRRKTLRRAKIEGFQRNLGHLDCLKHPICLCELGLHCLMCRFVGCGRFGCVCLAVFFPD